MTIKEAYTRYFLNASVLNRLIIINVFLFIITYVISPLFNIKINLYREFIGFPNDIFEYIKKPWTMITYAFFHEDFRHVFFNMLLLYFFGQIFLNIHNGRRFLNVYILGIIFGALMYMVAYAIFPAFSNIYGNMIGASAAMSAIMIASTVQSPDMPIKLLFIPFTFKLWWITTFFLVTDLLRIGSLQNAGGHFAHLGGAAIGYIYMVQLQKGNDIGISVEKTMDWFVGLFKPKEKSNLKTVHKSKQTSKKYKTAPSSKSPNQAQIDAILDKISKNGYESLSKVEKEILFKAGKN